MLALHYESHCEFIMNCVDTFSNAATCKTVSAELEAFGFGSLEVYQVLGQVTLGLGLGSICLVAMRS